MSLLGRSLRAVLVIVLIVWLALISVMVSWTNRVAIDGSPLNQPPPRVMINNLAQKEQALRLEREHLAQQQRELELVSKAQQERQLQLDLAQREQERQRLVIEHEQQQRDHARQRAIDDGGDAATATATSTRNAMNRMGINNDDNNNVGAVDTAPVVVKTNAIKHEQQQHDELPQALVEEAPRDARHRTLHNISTERTLKSSTVSSSNSKLKDPTNEPPIDDSLAYSNLLWEMLHPPIEEPLRHMEHSSDYRAALAVSSGHWDFLDHFFDSNYQGSVLVFGSGIGTVSMRVAKKFVSSPVISVESNLEAIHNHTMRLKEQGYPNNVVCQRPLSVDLVEDLYYHSTALFRYQVLANLQALISELLPHEITRVIGQQLSLAAHTAVIFPRQEMYDKYLRPWGGSVRRLVAEAAEAEGLSGSIETLSDSERYRAVAFHISKPFNRTMPYACAKQQNAGYGCQVEIPLEVSFTERIDPNKDKEKEKDKKKDDKKRKSSWSSDSDGEDEKITPEQAFIRPMADVKAFGTSKMIDGVQLPPKLTLKRTPIDWNYVSLHTLLLLNPTTYHRRQLLEMLSFATVTTADDDRLPETLLQPRVLVHHMHFSDAQFELGIIANAIVDVTDNSTAPLPSSGSKRLAAEDTKPESKEAKAPASHPISKPGPPVHRPDSSSPMVGRAPSKYSIVDKPSSAKDKGKGKDKHEEAVDDLKDEDEKDHKDNKENEEPSDSKSKGKDKGKEPADVKKEPEPEKKPAVDDDSVTEAEADAPTKGLDLWQDFFKPNNPPPPRREPEEKKHAADEEEEEDSPEKRKLAYLEKLRQQKEDEEKWNRRGLFSSRDDESGGIDYTKYWYQPPTSSSDAPAPSPASVPEAPALLHAIDIEKFDAIWEALQATLVPSERQPGALAGLSWKHLRRPPTTSSLAPATNTEFSWLIHSSGLGMLAQKIARKYPHSTVVSVERSMQQLRIQDSSLKSLGVSNVMLCRSPFSQTRVARVLDTPHLFRYQVLPRSLLVSFVLQGSQDTEGYCRFLGSSLKLAMTSFLEVPSEQLLRAAIPLFTTAESLDGDERTTAAGSSSSTSNNPTDWIENFAKDLFPREVGGKAPVRSTELTPNDRSALLATAIVTQCARQQGIERFTVSTINKRLLRVDISELRRTVLSRTGASVELSGSLSLGRGGRSQSNEQNLVVSLGSNSVPASNAHVNLHTLLELGLVNQYKRRALLSFFDVAAASRDKLTELPPWNVLVLAHNSTDAKVITERLTSIGAGEYALGESPLPLAYLNAKTSRFGWSESAALAHRQRVAQLLRQSLRPEHSAATSGFSFLEYNSHLGDVSMTLASSNPKSTVVSLERSRALVQQHRKRAGAHLNNLICEQEPTATFVQTLQNSPEFFQYQLYNGLLHKIYAMSDIRSFKRHVGRLLTLAQVTFLDLPSSAFLSLAHTIFFPFNDVAGEFAVMDDDGDLDTELWQLPAELARQVALATRHSSRLSTTVQRQLSVMTPTDPTVYQLSRHPLAEPGVFVESERKFLQAFVDNEQIASFDVTRLAVVDDGRSVIRVDALNFNRTVGHHFIREEDRNRDRHERKYKLRNIGTEAAMVRSEDGSRIVYDTFGISLIALLRMGASNFMKDRLYEQFVRLPLYLDMAPWNLQFRAGDLHYLDKDTMDNTFDRFTPHAYQLILAMINYKRALEDFNRCSSDASTKYGVPHVGICVGGAKLKEGKKCGEEKPVACHDGQCHYSFRECLISLAEKEIDTRRLLAQGSSSNSPWNREYTEEDERKDTRKPTITYRVSNN